MSSPCPFCSIDIPLAEIERHANDHLEEEELARDMDLAHQMALSSPGPSHVINSIEEHDISINNPISSIYVLQVKESFHKVEGGLMNLLNSCLDMETDNTKNIISGYIDHFQIMESEDLGWGCGWRNIQMLTSHLLIERHEQKEAVFGGFGFVPDIPSLQKWLELAWKRGFDVPGAKSFNYRIHGSKKWIGATECAALFRSFGLWARIIDFDGLNQSSLSSHGQVHHAKKVKITQKNFNGPMNKFVPHDDIDDLSPEDNSSKRGSRVLADWVWDYFNSGVSGQCSHKVTVSEKMPLYFQHSGHSRTIIGIQMKEGRTGTENSYNLLVLDPSQKTAVLERSLLDRNGWQKLIKRGVHTLKKPQYQLCYIDSGIADEEEIERLKFLDSVLIKI